MHDLPLPPPTVETLVFAGLGLGAFVTWIVMRGAKQAAYQEGFAHGLAEDQEERDELRARVAQLERDLELELKLKAANGQNTDAQG